MNAFASLQVTQANSNPIIPLALAKQHLRVDQPFDDGLIPVYLAAATQMVENYLNRTLLTQTLTFTLGNHSRFPSFGTLALPNQMAGGYFGNWQGFRALMLPRSPVQSVVSVTRGFWGYEDLTLVQGSDYDVDLTSTPGRVLLYNNFYNLYDQDHIQVVYTAGYSDTADSVPAQIKMAILLILTALYYNRGDDDREVLTPQARSLLNAYVEITFGNYFD